MKNGVVESGLDIELIHECLIIGRHTSTSRPPMSPGNVMLKPLTFVFAGGIIVPFEGSNGNKFHNHSAVGTELGINLVRYIGKPESIVCGGHRDLKGSGE